jgi:peptidoglycan/LPS O-acetylase OafA/YrhL
MTRIEGIKVYLSITGSSGKFPALDGLRAIAIILVLLRHCATSFFEIHNSDAVDVVWINNILKNGWSGVDLFFVLSGFLIAYHLMQRWPKENELKFVFLYWLKRILRTFPVYWAMIFLCVYGFVPFYVLPSSNIESSIFHHLIFMQDYYGADILVPLWSLATEEKFYLLAPLGAFLFRKKFSNNWILISFLISIIFIPLVLRIGSISQMRFDNYSDFFWFVRAPFHHAFDGLMLGVLVAVLKKRFDGVHCCEKISNILFLLGVFLCVTLLVCCEWMVEGGWYSASWVLFLFPVGFSFLVFGCVFSESINKSILSSRKLLFFSRISYSLYVVHYALISAASLIYIKIFSTVFSGWSFFVFLVIYVLLSVVASIVMHLVVEKPFLILKNKF